MDFKTFFMAMTLKERDAFASRCETTRGHLNNIAYRLKPCAEKLAIAIDRESGGVVRCETLRDDVDWAYIRNSAQTPEAEDPHQEAA